MMTRKWTLPIIVILAAVVSLSAAVGISSVNAQNMTGNQTGGNMTNATAGGNMTNATAGGGANMTSPSPILPPIK
jgi:hypothetical protein